MCADEDDSKTLLTGALQRQCLREATRGRCESGARKSDAKICPEQAGKAPLDHLTGRLVKGGTGRGVPSAQEAPSQTKRSDGCRGQKSRKRAIRNSLHGIGQISQGPGRQSKATVHDRNDDVRDVGLETLGNKVSHNVSGAPKVAAPVPDAGHRKQ